MKKRLSIIIVSLVVVIGLSFYGGMSYATSKNSKQVPGNFNRVGMNIRPQGSRQADGSFINGEIISQDDKSITIKLRDGGSKIVLLSASTTVSRLATSTIADLASGINVMINGTSNSDGSLSAQSIQLSPAFTPERLPSR